MPTCVPNRNENYLILFSFLNSHQAWNPQRSSFSSAMAKPSWSNRPGMDRKHLWHRRPQPLWECSSQLFCFVLFPAAFPSRSYQVQQVVLIGTISSSRGAQEIPLVVNPYGLFSPSGRTRTPQKARHSSAV